MNKRIIVPLLIASLSSPIIADGFGEGFGVGAFTGLVGGIITSKIANANTPPPVVIVEDPYLAQKQYDLQMQQEQLRLNRLEQRRKERQLALQEQENYAQAIELDRARRAAPKVREVTIVKTETVVPKRNKDKELREREIALKEQEVKLALIKEENRKREFSIKEKELELKLVSSRNQKNNTKVITTKKITKKTVADHSDDDYLDAE